MMSDTYDVIIIGGGHNGLITAAYLAKTGRKVLVLEKKRTIGGIAVTEAFFPGFKASSITDESDSLSPKIVADLQLSQLGLKVLPADPLVFAPQKDGRHLTIWHNVQRTAREIAPFSQADADAYPQFIKEMGKVAQIITALNHTIMPDMPHVGFKDMLEMLRLVKPIRSLGWKNITQVMRIIPLTVADLLSEWFESDIVKAAIAASALNNISLGPQESGTAYSFLQNFANSNNGLFRSGGQVKGGMGALSQTLADAANKFGAQILTNTEVSQISTDNGSTNGVVLANGNTFSAGTVVSALDMRSTFLQLVDSSQMDKTFLKNVQKITYCGTMARVHFALNGLPTFTGTTGNEQQLLSGHIQLAPSIVALQKAFDPVKYGQFTERPYLDIRIPTLNDPSLAPEDKHVMSVTVKYIPYHLRNGNWEALRDALGRLVIKTISDLAPDFEQCVEHCHVITPLDMETAYDLPEGSLAHGDTRLDQSFWMRPIPGFTQYQAPLKGLYFCGAATHPGAGVTGINGLNAARRILRGKN